MTHKVYRGPAGQGARPVTVSVCEGEGEHSWAVSSAPLEHHVLHSPDGFGWGYSGSGPAELARCLLWDHLGAEPHPAAYQALKNRLIVPVHPEFGFSCTTADLAQFCAGYRGPLTPEWPTNGGGFPPKPMPLSPDASVLREHVLLGHHEEMVAVPADHLGNLIIDRWHRMEHQRSGLDHDHGGGR